MQFSRTPTETPSPCSSPQAECSPQALFQSNSLFFFRFDQKTARFTPLLQELCPSIDKTRIRTRPQTFFTLQRTVSAERAKAQSAQIAQIQDSNRVRILEFIKANPGTHLRKIKRELNLAMGVIQYHLYKLERERSVVSVRLGLYKRFYADKGFRVEDREILSILSQETERDIVLYLIKNPLATQKELSEFARISPSSTNWHMKRLSQAGFGEPRREGGFVFYTVRGDRARILALLRRFHPRIWERWAERLADLLA